MITIHQDWEFLRLAINYKEPLCIFQGATMSLSPEAERCQWKEWSVSEHLEQNQHIQNLKVEVSLA